MRLIGFALIVSLSLAGCNLPGYAGSAFDVGLALNTPRPTYVLAISGATITPTPFQPLSGQIALEMDATPLASQTPIELGSPTPVAPIATVAEQTSLDQVPNQFNILLLGSDQRPWDVGFRTDTIVLLTLNKDLGSANVTSFPRDLYLTIPAWGWGRINTVFSQGGFNLLAETLDYNFGIRPDFYILVNFSSFKRIVDSLGGLDVNVGTALSDYRAGYWVNIPSGMVHMDADTVLWYVRSRATTSDFDRNQRQQEVLEALFEKLMSLDALKRAPEFYQVYKDNVTTDIGLVDILSWLPLAAKIADSRNINRYFIGRSQVYDWITPEGGMVLVPIQDAVMQVIRLSQNLP